MLIVGVIGVLTIAAATAFGPRIGVATPLLLVVLGIGVGLIPAIPDLPSDPELLLLGVLPPLLYSSSVSMPAMNFRREFAAIGGLSVVLVIASALILGFFFSWAIPGLPLAWGIALGAVISPTDAVATSIIKKVGVSPRAVSILEGESLLNDATALVLLKSAVAAVAASFSFWGAAGNFVYSVLVAVGIGFLVGRVNLWIRSRVGDATVNTVIGFAVPFVASLPAEHLGASGLVAAVVAGLVTGRGAPRVLSPEHRLSDAQNWRTVELVLEGALFLMMGLQLSGIVTDLREDSIGIAAAAGIAAGALVLTIVVRGVYIGLLMRGLKYRANRYTAEKDRFSTMKGRLDRGEPLIMPDERGPAGGRERFERATQDPGRLSMFTTRLVRGLADIEYYLKAPLGWKEGTVLIWAGMRGAVTLAAAQTLPETGVPHRTLLIFVAFAVAAGSLLIQGGTIGWLVKLLKPAVPDPADEFDERSKIMEVLRTASEEVITERGAEGPFDKQTRLAVLDAQRNALLDARDDGTFDADILSNSLTVLDADQIAITLRGGPKQ